MLCMDHLYRVLVKMFQSMHHHMSIMLCHKDLESSESVRSCQGVSVQYVVNNISNYLLHIGDKGLVE